VASQTLGDGSEGEIAHDLREAPHSPRHRFEDGEGDVRISPAKIEEVGPTQEEHLRRAGRDSRGDVPAPVEQGPLAEGGAGPLGVEHLLPTSKRSLTDLDRALRDDEEPVARLPFLEEDLTGT